MSSTEAIAAISITPEIGVDPIQNNVPADVATSQSFGDMLAQGLDMVENKVTAANELAREFAINDSIPIHQVTIALEEARLAVELAMQVRTRLVEGYREIMNMQL